MVTDHTKSQILKQFLELCQPSSHRPLEFLPLDEDVYRVPAEPDAVLDALTANFATDALVETGLVAQGEEGAAPALSPGLEAERDFIVLRDVDSGEPFELLTTAGCLTEEAIPVFEVLRDRRTQELLGPQKSRQLSEVRRLVVAFDLESVHILRACGIAATLAVGLDDLPLDDVEQFNEWFSFESLRHFFKSSSASPPFGGGPPPWGVPFGHSPPGVSGGPDELDTAQAEPTNVNHSEVSSSDEQPERKGVSLVFLGWMVSGLSEAMPLKLKAVVDFLRQLEQTVGLELDGINLWESRAEAIDGLRFVAGRHHAPSFQQVLQQEFESNITGIRHLGQEPVKPPEPPADYPQALARLREAATRTRRRDRLGRDPRKQAWDDVQRLLHAQLVDPLREQAIRNDDLIQRILLLGCADLAYIFHVQSATLIEQISQSMVSFSDNTEPLLSDKSAQQIKNLLATADRMLGLAREAS